MSGQCVNRTDHNIVVYGSKNNPNTLQETGLYVLFEGKTTKDDWGCDGLYILPGQRIRQYSGGMITGPTAIKFGDFIICNPKYSQSVRKFQKYN